MDTERLDLLAQVASWYYDDNLSQDEIAGRIDRSRSMVSRMLQEARDAGLVEIQVHYPLRTDPLLAEELARTFGLQEALVLARSPSDYNAMLRRLGNLGARQLQGVLRDGIQIGMGWGTAVYEVVRAMPRVALQDARVVQIIGSVGFGDPMVDGMELARWLADKLDANYRSMYAPLIVENAEVAQGLLRDRSVAEVLALAAQVDVVVMGVGVLHPPTLTGLWRAGYLSEEDLAGLRRDGGVCEVLSHPLTLEGQGVDNPISRRLIGVDLETLRGVSTVMAVAGGLVKGPAILGALRSGYVNILVTDAEAAKAALAIHRGETAAAAVISAAL
jgi:deoxyribonucleoside regulator